MGPDETPGKIFIAGTEWGGEIPEFKMDEDACTEYIRSEIKKNSRVEIKDGRPTFVGTVRWDWLKICLLIGLHDYVCEYCPNRRVVHLIKYHKNKRVRLKNLKRAVHIVGVLLDRQERSKR